MANRVITNGEARNPNFKPSGPIGLPEFDKVWVRWLSDRIAAETHMCDNAAPKRIPDKAKGRVRKRAACIQGFIARR